MGLFLTNKPHSFQFTSVAETGLRDYHSLITTFIKSHFSRLKPKSIHVKRLDQQKFIADVKNADFSSDTDALYENYLAITNVCSLIGEKHGPLKKKTVRGNHDLFLSKDLIKVIYRRSRLKTNLLKILLRLTKNTQKPHNKCVSIRKKLMQRYFSDITSNDIVTNKKFWKTMKSFLPNNIYLDKTDIMLRGDNDMTTDEKHLAKLFNEYYINIVEWSTGLKTEKIACHNQDLDKRILLQNFVIKKYENLAK